MFGLLNHHYATAAVTFKTHRFLGGLSSGRRRREDVGAVALVLSLGNDTITYGFSVHFNLVLAASGPLFYVDSVNVF